MSTVKEAVVVPELIWMRRRNKPPAPSGSQTAIPRPSIPQPSQYIDQAIPAGLNARFSTPVQTGPGAHPASYKTGTGSFPGVKRPGRGVDHPSPISIEVKETVELYIYSTSEPSWPVIG